jgi:hypothetical protein
MKYTRKRFTLPANNKKMSDLAYGIAVGTHCAKCKKLTQECKCK